MLLSASSMIGDPVVSLGGDSLGTVKEIMIRLADGAISYVVLARGGVMGMGERLYAVPWNLLEIDAHRRALVLDLSPDVLDDTPGFDPDNWPTVTTEWRTAPPAERTDAI